MAGKKKVSIPRPMLIEVEGMTLYKLPTKHFSYSSVKLSKAASESLGFKRRVVRSGHVSLHQVYGSGNLSYVKVVTVGTDGPKFIVPDSQITYGKGS